MNDVKARPHQLIASDRVEGTSVRRPNGDRIGHIERLMIDKISGKVSYAILSFGGFLGMGTNLLPLPWARLFATVPSTETVFSQAQIVGCGHGDGRGEFVLALDAKASTGAALKNPVPVRLWAFVPPAGPNLHPDDPLAQLPVEMCGTAVDSSVIRGLAVPPGYSVQQSRDLALRLGETLSGSGAEFLFAL